MDSGSMGLMAAFVALPLLVAAAFVTGVRWSVVRSGGTAGSANRQAAVAALVTAAWMGGMLVLAWSGRLSFETRPPTMLPVLFAMVALGSWTGLSGVGRRLALGLPLAALVGVQAFRLPLELGMHRAYGEGLMPVQMSYSGYNFDIVTGASAVVLAAVLVAGRAPVWLVRVWNWMGFALLVNVVTIAVLSTPLPIRLFHNEPVNVWVTQAPYIWLPTVLVLAALLGHILVFRRLRAEAAAARVGAGAAEEGGAAAHDAGSAGRRQLATMAGAALLAVASVAALPASAAGQAAPGVVVGAGVGGTYYCIVSRCNTGTLLQATAGVDVMEYVHVEAGVRRHSCFDCSEFTIVDGTVLLRRETGPLTPFVGAGYGRVADAEFMGTRWAFHGAAGTWYRPGRRWGVQVALRGRELGSGDRMGEASVGVSLHW
jgi:hypothetical protein